MSNVINIEKQDVIWVCECDCMSFELHSNGDAICASCGTLTDASGWRQNLSDPEGEIDVLPDGAKTDLRFNSENRADFAKYQVIERIKSDGAFVAIVLNREGRKTIWQDDAFATDDQKKWLSEALKTIEDMLTENSRNADI